MEEQSKAVTYLKRHYNSARDIATEEINILPNERGEAIKKLLESHGTGVPKRDVYNWQKELILQHKQKRYDAIELLKIINIIRDNTGYDSPYFIPFEDEKKWEQAILLCLAVHKYHDYYAEMSESELSRDYPRQMSSVEGLINLEHLGCNLSIVNEEITIVSGLENVVNKLEVMIEEAGAQRVLSLLIEHLLQEKRYFAPLERYLIPIMSNNIIVNPIPHIPYGLIFNYCLKHIHKRQNAPILPNIYRNILNLSMALTNALDIQEYNQWAAIMIKNSEIINFMKDRAIWDSIYNIRQCRPIDGLEISINILKWIEAGHFYKVLGFSLQEYSITMQEVINEANILGPVPIYQSKIIKATKGKVGRDQVIKILDATSHILVNEKFQDPSDYSLTDYFKKPLIRVSATKFIIPDKHFLYLSFYEVIAYKMRGEYKKDFFDNSVGMAQEQYLKDKLNQRGIRFHSGKFSFLGKNAEADLVIETDDHVLIVELKKKPLTMKAKSGDDTSLIIDIFKALIESQIQAKKVQIILSKNGEIDFLNDGVVSNLKLNNRICELISVSLFDYGSFNDKNFVSQFLQLIHTIGFNTTSSEPSLIKLFDEIENLRKEWDDLYLIAKKDKKMEEEMNKLLYVNSWFLTIPQLIDLINSSSSANDLSQFLSLFKYVTFSSFDFYQELIAAMQIRKSGINNLASLGGARVVMLN